MEPKSTVTVFSVTVKLYGDVGTAKIETVRFCKNNMWLVGKIKLN